MQKHTLAATARAETEAAARYLGQLCKHFAHKLTVDYDPETKPGEGLIHFPWGACRLRAVDGGLELEARASTEDELARVCRVMEDHLRRFAWRENLELSWTDGAAPQPQQ